MFDSLFSIFEGHRLVKAFLTELFDVEKFLSRAQGVQELINRGGTEGEKAAARAAMERMKDRAAEESKELSPDEQARFKARFASILNGNAQAQKPRPNWSRPPPREEPRPKPKPEQSKAFTFKNDDLVCLSKAEDRIGHVVGMAWKPGMPGSKAIEWVTVRWLTGEERGNEQNIMAGNLRIYDPKADARRRERHEQQEREERAYRQERAREREYGGDRVIHLAEFTEGTSNKVYGVVQKDGRVYTFWGRRAGPYSTKQFDNTYEADAVFRKKCAKGYEEIRVDSFWTKQVFQNASF